MTPPPLKRSLLIEDEPDIQTIAQLALESVGGFTSADRGVASALELVDEDAC